MNKLNVTVFLEVYNEEARIEECLRCFQWAKQVIVFDKNSTDRTREIAEKYAEVILIKYSDTGENVPSMMAHFKYDWILAITASSLIHPDLVAQIRDIVEDAEYKFDVIGLPYRMYTMGICDPHSPWYTSHKYSLIRKTALNLTAMLHQEISFKSDSMHNLVPKTDESYFYHLTHENLEMFFERVHRYTNAEGKNEIAKAKDAKEAYKKSFMQLLKSVFTVLIRRRTFMLGWDGVALSIAYISYYMIKFLRTWDYSRSSTRVDYNSVRKSLGSSWSEKSKEP